MAPRCFGRLGLDLPKLFTSLSLPAKAEMGAEQGLLALLAKTLKYLEDFCLAWMIQVSCLFLLMPSKSKIGNKLTAEPWSVRGPWGVLSEGRLRLSSRDSPWPHF